MIKEGKIEKIKTKEEDKEILSKEEIEEIVDESYLLKHEERLINRIGETLYELAKEFEEGDYRVLTPTETSAVPYGYGLKEIWSSIYPDKPKPIVIPINVKLLARGRPDILKYYPKTDYSRNMDPEYSRVSKHYRKRFNQYNLDPERDKVLIFDEAKSDGITRNEAWKVLRKTGIEEVEISRIDNAPRIFNELSSQIPNLNKYYKDKKEIEWVEETTRVPDVNIEKRITWEKYKKLDEQVGVPRKNREEAKALIHDMKLIGKKVGEKMKKREGRIRK